MISLLPVEIHVELMKLDPSSSIRLTNTYFYTLYNDLYYEKIIRTFGEDIVNVLIKVLPWLKTYIRSLDVFRYQSRNSIASRLGLTDNDDPDNPLHCIYIKDSWKYIYSILKNKRLFAEYSDYKIDEPTNYVYNHFVEINRTYLLSYSKCVWLPPGNYNLNIGLVIKHGNGLGTTKFEIKHENEIGKIETQTFYPPTNINDILPKQQFCLLKLGEFQLPPKRNYSKNKKRNDHHDKLHKVQFTMEEIGLYLKSGFRIFFIDISQPSVLFNEFDLLYYTVRETDYRYFINIPLKNLYKAINYVQNGGVLDNLSVQKATEKYGCGNPYSIMDQYDNRSILEHIVQNHNNYNNYNWNESYNEANNQNEANTDDEDLNSINNKQLMKYADFYYNKAFIRRYFKFNTVYQRRQFVNRYGEFDIDWKRGEHEISNLKFASLQENTDYIDKSNEEKSCLYDKYGFRWKIPVLGEL